MAWAAAAVGAHETSTRQSLKRGLTQDIQTRSRRPLAALPKTLLHLHWGEAMIRRSTLEECANHEKWLTAGAVKAKKVAEDEVTKWSERGNQNFASTWRRRANLVRDADPIRLIAETFGPKPPASDGGAETATLEDLRRIDALDKQTGREGVWDQKWVAKLLLETVLGEEGNKDAWEERAMRELYEDAAAEGVTWIEVSQGNSGFTDDKGVVKEKAIKEWTLRLSYWEKYEAEFAGRVSMRFIFCVPKEPLGARAWLEWIKGNPLASKALVGVGAWAREYSMRQRGKSFKICCDAGWPALNVHAGEHCFQCAAPEGGEVEPELERTYDGCRHIRDALRVARASRIGHGIQAVHESALMDELAGRANDVCLEICLMSNRCLDYCPQGLAKHQLTQLHGHGITCTLASDDPTYFGSPNGSGMIREYMVARHILNMSDETIAQLARNGFQHSRAPAEVKARNIAAINAWLRRPADGSMPTDIGKVEAKPDLITKITARDRGTPWAAEDTTALAKQLGHSDARDLESLELDDVKLGDDGMKEITKGMRIGPKGGQQLSTVPVLTHLSLRNCGLDKAGAQTIIEAIKICAVPALVSLDVRGNPFCSDEETAAQLAQVSALWEVECKTNDAPA